MFLRRDLSIFCTIYILGRKSLRQLILCATRLQYLWSAGYIFRATSRRLLAQSKNQLRERAGKWGRRRWERDVVGLLRSWASYVKLCIWDGSHRFQEFKEISVRKFAFPEYMHGHLEVRQVRKGKILIYGDIIKEFQPRLLTHRVLLLLGFQTSSLKYQIVLVP
jgi:hypothetical protein